MDGWMDWDGRKKKEAWGGGREDIGYAAAVAAETEGVG